MGKFIHHPDGLIIIDDYKIPLPDFIAQYPDYTLHPKATGRIYKQGVCHFLSDGTNQAAGQYPWTDGDEYIANKYIFAPVPDKEPTLDEVKTLAIARIKSEANAQFESYKSLLEVLVTLFSGTQEQKDELAAIISSALLKFTSLRSQINAATTINDVNSVSW